MLLKVFTSVCAGRLMSACTDEVHDSSSEG